MYIVFPDSYDWYSVFKRPFVLYPVNPFVSFLHWRFLFIDKSITMIEIPVNLNYHICIRTIEIIKPSDVLRFVLPYVLNTDNIQELRSEQVFKFGCPIFRMRPFLLCRLFLRARLLCGLYSFPYWLCHVVSLRYYMKL